MKQRKKSIIEEILEVANEFFLVIKRLNFGQKSQLALFMRFYSFRKNLKSYDAITQCKEAFRINIGEGSREYKIMALLQKERARGVRFQFSNVLNDNFTSDIKMMFTIVEHQTEDQTIDAEKLKSQKEQELLIKKQTTFKVLKAFFILIGSFVTLFVTNMIVPELSQTLDAPLDDWKVDFAFAFTNHILNNFNWLKYIVFFLLSSIVIKMYMLPKYTGTYRSYLDKLPIFSAYKALEAARFYTVLALLKDSNYKTKHALTLILNIVPNYTKSYVSEMQNEMARGSYAAVALSTGLLNGYQSVRLNSVVQGGSNDGDVVSRALSELAENMVEDTIDGINLSNKMLLTILYGSAGFIAYAGIGALGGSIMKIIQTI